MSKFNFLIDGEMPVVEPVTCSDAAPKISSADPTMDPIELNANFALQEPVAFLRVDPARNLSFPLNSRFNGAVDFDGRAQFNGPTSFSGRADFWSNTLFNYPASFNSSVSFNSGANFGGPVSINGSLTLNGRMLTQSQINRLFDILGN